MAKALSMLLVLAGYTIAVVGWARVHGKTLSFTDAIWPGKYTGTMAATSSSTSTTSSSSSTLTTAGAGLTGVGAGVGTGLGYSPDTQYSQPIGPGLTP